MKVSEMISALEKFREDHGDLEVMVYDALNGSAKTHHGPKLQAIKVKKGREYLDRFWYHFSDDPDRKGPDVCRM